MDYPTTPSKSPADELQRLSTFGRSPIPRGLCTSISNTPSKFSASYFERQDGATGDEVFCKSCGVTYRNWKGEKPVVVHRVISPKCPALNSPPPGGDDVQSPAFLETLQDNPFREYLPATVQRQLDAETPTLSDATGSNRVRRQLFASSTAEDNRSESPLHQRRAADGTPVSPSAVRPAAVAPGSGASVLCRPVIKHPFKPLTGQYCDLFASVRLNTYTGTTPLNQAWAEEGFVCLGEGQVQCVFCGATAVKNGLHPHSVHQKMNPSCPFLLGLELGNISCKEELEIRMKYLDQQQAKTVPISTVKYPHYACDKARKASFKKWPKMCASVYPVDLMSLAGFYYTGCSDRVACFTCGIELCEWDPAVADPEAEVWQQHAKLSPQCDFIINQKDQEFIQKAADVEVHVEVKYHGKKNAPVTDKGMIVAAEIGSATLEESVLQAALSSRYPDENILLPVLKAWDENNVTLVEQQQALYQKDTVIQEKDTVIQERENHFQAVLQEKDTQLQRVIQEKQQAVLEKQRAVQRAVQAVQRAVQAEQQAEQQKEQAVQQVVHEKEAQLQLQDQQIRSLMQQVQMLRADRQPANPAAPGPNGDEAQAGAEMDSRQRMLCKICLTDELNMIFLPCGHVTSCVGCASRLPDRRCPVCRCDISQILPAFVV